MDGEQEAIDSVEPEFPIPAIEQEMDDKTSLDQSETEVEPADEDYDELDFGFQKYSVPKKLKEAVENLRASFTHKTQEFSAIRKELEAKAAQQSEVTEEYLDTRAELRTVAKELERFKDWGWTEYQQLRQSDPFAADEAWNYLQHLQAQKGQLTGKLQQHETQRSSEAQQDFAKRMNETAQFAREKIQGWTPETDKQVVEFALSKGVGQEQLASAMNPVVYEMLYLARIGAQTLSKPAAAKPQPQQPAPLKVVNAKTNPPARKSLADMDMDEYVARRRG